MKLRKTGKKKKNQKDKSSAYGFLFYSAALFVWSIYDFFINDRTGWQMPIVFIGISIYLWSKVFYQQQRVKKSLEIGNSSKRS